MYYYYINNHKSKNICWKVTLLKLKSWLCVLMLWQYVKQSCQYSKVQLNWNVILISIKKIILPSAFQTVSAWSMKPPVWTTHVQRAMSVCQALGKKNTAAYAQVVPMSNAQVTVKLISLSDKTEVSSWGPITGAN